VQQGALTGGDGLTQLQHVARRVGRAEYTPTTVTIVVAAEHAGRTQMMGMVVDGVSDVLDVSDDQIRPAPNLGKGIGTRFIRGMVSRDAHMVILLDVDRLLDPQELMALAELQE